MVAPTLAQALEGLNFPCDRAQLLDYARRNNLGESALEVLEAIPDRNYRDLGELFTALPGRPSQHGEEEGGEELPSALADIWGENFPALPAPLEWWLNGWRQMMMPWDATAQYLRGAAETWPQWLRLTRHLWFPWSKK